jgi:hypothetical protein
LTREFKEVNARLTDLAIGSCFITSDTHITRLYLKLVNGLSIQFGNGPIRQRNHRLRGSRAIGRPGIGKKLEGSRPNRAPIPSSRRTCWNTGAHGTAFWPWARTGSNGVIEHTLTSVVRYDYLNAATDSAPMYTADCLGPGDQSLLSIKD